MSQERSITAAMKAGFSDRELSVFLALQMDFPSGSVYAWTGAGNLLWDGKTWVGLGAFGAVSGLVETEDSRAQNVQFSLSGIPSALIDPVTTDDYQGSPAILYFGILDDGGNVVADPAILHSGILSSDEIEDTGETASITFTSTNRLSDALRKREWRYTHEDQRGLHPGETDYGFEFVAELQDVKVKWGGAS